jgi:hypothetical protein
MCVLVESIVTSLLLTVKCSSSKIASLVIYALKDLRSPHPLMVLREGNVIRAIIALGVLLR